MKDEKGRGEETEARSQKSEIRKEEDKNCPRKTTKLPLEGVWGTQPSLSGSLRAGALKSWFGSVNFLMSNQANLTGNQRF